MTGPTARDRAVAELARALRRAGLCLEPDLGDLGMLADLLADAAAERALAGRDGRWGRRSGPPGPTPLREELRPAADPAPSRPGVRWEYAARSFRCDHLDRVGAELDRAGEDGWEAYAVEKERTGGTPQFLVFVYFKRPAPGD